MTRQQPTSQRQQQLLMDLRDKTCTRQQKDGHDVYIVEDSTGNYVDTYNRVTIDRLTVLGWIYLDGDTVKLIPEPTNET